MPVSDRPNRVLFCTDTHPPQVNGVSVVTALSVSGLQERGWECAVIAPRYPRRAYNAFDAGNAPPAPGPRVAIPSVPVPGYAEIRLAAPWYGEIARRIRSFRPDLVHCETEFVIGRLGQIAAERAGIPFVTSYHTDFSRYTVAYGAPWLRGTVSRYIARFHRRARRTYTPSEPAKQDLAAAGVSDVEVWGRGVDADVFHPARRSQPLRGTFGVADRFVFLYVGRLAAEKNIDVVLEAFALTRRLLPHDSVHLFIAGTGPYERRLRRQAPDGVTFLGHLDRRRRLPVFYASADAFVFASVTETLGLVVLEAMASGLPVIAAPAGGVKDHLHDGVNGLTYPPNDPAAMAHAMVRLVMDTTLARTLGAGARETATARSWQHELDRLDESYREICAGATAAPQRSPASENVRRAVVALRPA